jgi:hypothetical protein
MFSAPRGAAKNWVRKALNKIKGTSLDKGNELDALAALPKEKREELVERAAAGENVTGSFGSIGIRWCGWRPVWPGAFKRGTGEPTGAPADWRHKAKARLESSRDALGPGNRESTHLDR